MKKTTKIIIYTLIFISLLIFCYFFPYSGDDYSWSGSYGIFELKNFFQNLNGRYLGNLLVILISRNNIIKTIFMSSIIFLILYLASKLIKKENTLSMILLYILFLLMYPKVFSQGVIWSSGFCNYATSTLMILLVIYFIYYQKTFKYSKIVYFLLGFISSFFVENISIGLFLFTLTLNIYYYHKNKKINSQYLALLIGSFLGCLLMFLNPSYLKLFNHQDDYRVITFPDLTIFMFPFVFENNILNITKILVIVLIMIKTKKKKNYLIGFLVTIIITLCQFHFLFPKIVIYILSCIYLILLGLLIIFNKDIWQRKQKLNILMIILTILPLMIVTPFGARNFLTTYLLSCVIYLSILFDFNLKWLNKFSPILIGGGLLIFNYTLVFSTYYQDFREIKKATNKLIAEVNRGDKIVYVDKKLMEDNIVHNAFPRSQNKDDFCQFYQIPCDWIISYGPPEK